MVKWDPGKIIRDPRGEITGVARDSSAQRACDVIRAWLDCILNRAKKWSVCLRSETSLLQNNEKKNTEAQVNHFSFIILDEWVMKSPWPLASTCTHFNSITNIISDAKCKKILNGRNTCIIEVRLVIYCRRFCFSPTYAHRSLSTCLGKSRVEAVRWKITCKWWLHFVKML